MLIAICVQCMYVLHRTLGPTCLDALTKKAFHHFIASLVNKFSSVFAHLSNPPASSSRTSQTSPLPASPVGMPPQPTDMAARRSRREGKTGTTPDEPEVSLRGPRLRPFSSTRRWILKAR